MFGMHRHVPSSQKISATFTFCNCGWLLQCSVWLVFCASVTSDLRTDCNSEASLWGESSTFRQGSHFLQDLTYKHALSIQKFTQGSSCVIITWSSGQLWLWDNDDVGERLSQGKIFCSGGSRDDLSSSLLFLMCRRYLLQICCKSSLTWVISPAKKNSTCIGSKFGQLYVVPLLLPPSCATSIGSNFGQHVMPFAFNLTNSMPTDNANRAFQGKQCGNAKNVTWWPKIFIIC